MNETAEGARCALHPERQATGTCARCGNYACDECDASSLGEATVCRSCAETSAPSRYHVVPAWRFVLFNVLTLGFYAVYWAWKNWSQIKKADDSAIWPVPRAFFSGFTNFWLFDDINGRLESRGIHRRVSAGYAVGYLLSNLVSRLPDPWWLVSIAGFAFLLPAVHAINALASEAAVHESAGWRVRHTVLVVLSTPFLLLAIAAAVMPESALE